MGVTKREGVVEGYPSVSVGYRVWDPVRGKVFNVGVPFVDEDVKPGWWRKADDGGVVEEMEEFIFPHQDVDSSQQQVQLGGEHIAAVDGGVEPLMPNLVEDSSDDEDDDEDPGGDDDQWGPEDDAMEVQHVEQPAPSGPRQSNTEKRGVPSLRFIEEYLAATMEQEVKQSPQSVQEAMQGLHSEKWKREIVDRPAGKKVVKSKWVFRVKTNELG